MNTNGMVRSQTFVLVPEHIVYRLPKELSFDHAALVEALSVAVHAVSRSQVGSGDAVLVVGSGMIGLLVIQVLSHTGCSSIIAADRDAQRLQLALDFGADVTLDTTKCNLPQGNSCRETTAAALMLRSKW